MLELEETTMCNLCGSTDLDIIIDGRWGKIAKCRQCDLMFRTTIIPDTSEPPGGIERFKAQYEAKQRNQLADYARCLPVLDKYVSSPDRDMLEIGSHMGHFLNLAREKGWRVRGVEPNKKAAAQAVEQFGLDVDTDYLRDVHFPDATFDVVTSFHVIEHFADPASEFKESHRILKPGGIFVAETPRYDTIWFKVLRERERSVIPYHYYYFTRRTLSEMLKRAGFTVLRVDSVGRTLSLDRLFFQLVKVVGSKKLHRLLIRMSDRLHLDRVIFYINIHDMMRIYARKD